MSSLMQNDVESLEQKDRMFFGLSDTLDVKASIGLVLIVFLASQTTNLLKNEMDPVLTFLQMICAVILFTAAMFALVTIWPRTHKVENTEQWGVFHEDLRRHFKCVGESSPDEKAFETFLLQRAEGLKEQIEHNRQITHRKYASVKWCYRSVVIAVALNLFTLAYLAFLV